MQHQAGAEMRARRRAARIRTGSAITAVAASTALLAAGCGSSNGSSSASAAGGKKTYTIGLSENASGTTGALFAGAAGLQAYFKDANAHGGVDGHQIDVKVLNDSGNAATASTNFTQLVGDGALAVVWSTLSNAYIPLETKAAAQKVPMFIISLLTPTPAPYIYGLQNESSHSLNKEVTFIKNQIGTGKRVAVVAGDTTGGHTEVKNASDFAQQEGFTVATQQFTPVDDVGLQANAAAILNSNADAVITAVDPTGTATLDQLLRQGGFKGPVVGFWAASTDANFAQNKDPNFYAYRNYASPSDTTLPAAVNMKNVGDQTGFSPKGDPAYTGYWVIGQTLAAAIKKCGDNCTPTSLNTALEGLGKIDTGGLAFDAELSKDNHDMPRQFQFYHYDPAKDAAVTVGGPISS